MPITAIGEWIDIQVSRFLLLMALIVLFIPSCYLPPKTYLNTLAMSPHLYERGDIDLQGTAGLNGAEGTLSYSPTAYTFVSAQAMGSLRGGGVLDYSAGLYWAKKENLRFTVSAGLGQGALHQSVDNWCRLIERTDCSDYSVDVNYRKQFLQFDMAGPLHNGLSFGITARFSEVEYLRYNFKQTYHVGRNKPPDNRNVDIKGLDNNLTYVNVGLYLRHRIDDGPLGLSVYVQSLELIEGDESHSPYTNRFHLSTAISFLLNHRKEKGVWDLNQ